LAAFTAPYDRPGYALFQAHCQRLIADAELERRQVRQRAVGLAPLGERGWRVETSEGGIEARRVLLALGLSEQPAWPDWARRLRAEGGPVRHVFDSDFHT
ncbi:MAG: hypothetical protein CFK52_15380, partial [Chloracidobacterium sp. CP2_5A]